MKILSFIIAATLLAISKFSLAAPLIYTFEGTVSGFQSYHQDYDISDFDVVIGETSLRYVFEVDFDAEQSSHTSTAGAGTSQTSLLILESPVFRDINHGNNRICYHIGSNFRSADMVCLCA